MNRTWHAIFLLIFLSAVVTTPLRAEEPVVPMIETYLSQNQVSQYINDAYAYLNRYPSSDYAPRVALDLLMVAERTGYKKLADKMKWFLIYEHGQSLQGTHTLSTFKTASEFRDFLLEHTEDQLSDNPVSFADKYSGIIDSGLFYFKEELLDDDDFLLISSCLADAAGNRKTTEVLLPAAKSLFRDDTRLAEILEICLDNGASAAEKAVKLHGQDKMRLLETYYLSTLSESEKKQPDISRILISNAIKAKNYKTAQLYMDAMPSNFQEDPQILFWKGWIQYARRDDRQALETLTALMEKFPQSRWTETSKVFSEGIRNADNYNQAIAGQIFSAMETLKDGIGILQAKIKLTVISEDGISQPYWVYLGLLPKKDFLELQMYRNKEMILAYRTRTSDSAICLAGSKKIISFNEPAVIPVPTISLQKQGNDEFELSAGLDFFSSIREAGIKTSSLFDSPYLSSIEGIYDLIDQSARRNGWVPADPVANGKTTSLNWHAASTDSPELRTMVCQLSGDSIITHFKYDNFSIEELRYSKGASFDLSLPPWPSYVIEKRESFDVQIFMELMGAAIHLLNDEYK